MARRRFFQIRNWSKFQGYKKRGPEWIKLYTALLAHYEFQLLPDAKKWHVIGLWLLAANTSNRLPWDPKWLQNKCGFDCEPDLSELQALEFIEPWCDTSVAGVATKVSHTRAREERREEESREEERRERPPTRAKGTRLDPNWALPQDWREWARANGNGLDLDLEADKFRDYWTAKSGNQATKVNWQATWRNWIRTALERHGQKPNGTIGLTYGKLKAMSSSELLGWATQLSVPTRGKSQYDLIADVLSAYQEQHA